MTEGGIQWLPWPTFFHSPATPSSWEHWRYMLRSEIGHAWPGSARQRRNGCSRVVKVEDGGGGGHSAHLLYNKKGSKGRPLQSFHASISDPGSACRRLSVSEYHKDGVCRWRQTSPLPLVLLLDFCVCPRAPAVGKPL